MVAHKILQFCGARSRFAQDDNKTANHVVFCLENGPEFNSPLYKQRQAFDQTKTPQQVPLYGGVPAGRGGIPSHWGGEPPQVVEGVKSPQKQKGKGVES